MNTYTVTIKQTRYLIYEVEAKDSKDAKMYYWDEDKGSRIITDEGGSEEVVTVGLKESKND